MIHSVHMFFSDTYWMIDFLRLLNLLSVDVLLKPGMLFALFSVRIQQVANVVCAGILEDFAFGMTASEGVPGGSAFKYAVLNFSVSSVQKIQKNKL